MTIAVEGRRLFLGHRGWEGPMPCASNDPSAYAIRKASPETRTLDALDRTPMCFSTLAKDMVIGC